MIWSFILYIIIFLFGFLAGYNFKWHRKPDCPIVIKGPYANKCDLKLGHDGPHHTWHMFQEIWFKEDQEFEAFEIKGRK